MRRDASRQRAPSSITLRDAAAEYLAGMRDGSITTRSGQPYKPSTIRCYDQWLGLHALPDLGGRRVADVTTGDIERLVECLGREGHASRTIANVINPLRAIYRRLVGTLAKAAIEASNGGGRSCVAVRASENVIAAELGRLYERV